MYIQHACHWHSSVFLELLREIRDQHSSSVVVPITRYLYSSSKQRHTEPILTFGFAGTTVKKKKLGKSKPIIINIIINNLYVLQTTDVCVYTTYYRTTTV
jgi:hypothetical protein